MKRNEEMKYCKDCKDFTILYLPIKPVRPTETALAVCKKTRAIFGFCDITKAGCQGGGAS